MSKALLAAIVLVIFMSTPAFAVTPPRDEDLAELALVPDFQERIEFAQKVLEPLLNKAPDPEGMMEVLGEGIRRNFDITSDAEGFVASYDKNSDSVIDERDFIEMVFTGELMHREANRSPKNGESHCAVIPIKFPDQEPDPAHDAAFWEDMFFGPSAASTRSFYIQSSVDSLYISGDVLTNPDETDGWWVAAHERSYYVDEGDLLGEVLDYADPYYDFSLYDADNNSEADGVYFLYAGDDTGWGSFYWGWATYGNYILDGTRVGPLMFCGENLMTWRVAAHEYGHMMGLPDLYDYNFINEVAWGIGNWGMMGKGNVYLSPWSRMTLGWADVIDVSMDKLGEEIFPQSLNSPVYRLWTEGASSDEYFMVSLGKHLGYDVNLPGEGLIIWHCDEAGNNSNWWHKKVDVEEADGLDDLDNFNNPGDDTDPYYDPNNTTFDDDSYPNSRDYNGQPTQVSVVNISVIGDSMTADLIVGIPGDLPVDETEPNDVWDDSGVQGLPIPNEIFDGKVDADDDVNDFWRYSTLKAGTIKADVIASNENANLSFYLWNSDGSELLAKSETTQASEHLEFTVPTYGNYFLQVKAESKSTYYDLFVAFVPLPYGENINAYGYSELPDHVYANTKTIPALRVSLLNGGCATSQMSEMRVYATGSAHYSISSASLWLDDGDVTFGPGNDILLAGPVPFDDNSRTALFSGFSQDLSIDTELFVTIDLDETQFEGGSVGLRMFAYKDITVSDCLLQFYNFPLNSTLATVTNPPMPLCYVAAGDFTMGSDPLTDPYYDPSCDYNQETPVHQNRTGDFYISQYEVTNGQFSQFIDDGGYDNALFWSSGWSWKNANEITTPNGWNEGDLPIGVDYPDHPVAGVSQHEARAYANYIGGRLPHEAEWEKAGRGTDGRIYTWGNTFDGSKAYFSYPPVEVGGYPQSDSLYGVSDLEGNVFEWMEDGWTNFMYQKYASGNFQPPTGGSYAMQRGYSWLIVGNCDTDYASRLSYRDTWQRWRRWTFLGFRIVYDPPS